MFKKAEKRVFFRKGYQEKLILKYQKEKTITTQQLSDKLGVHGRTLRDWKRGKYSMSLKAYKYILKHSHIKDTTTKKVKDPFWYVKLGASKGGINCYKKYGQIGGDQEHRKECWKKWWEETGMFDKRFKTIGKKIEILHPKHSERLAEFCGFMLGDGAITKNFISVSLNGTTDVEYGHFVGKLVESLFGVKLHLYHRPDSNVGIYTFNGVKLTEYCNKLGLVTGHKIRQQIDIPEWIKKNKKYSIACVRGLVDTDGCIFQHKYKVNEKWYSYVKIEFTSYSVPLRKSVIKILRSLGFNAQEKNNRDIRIENQKDVRGYFNIIGTSNPKHTKRRGTQVAYEESLLNFYRGKTLSRVRIPPSPQM